jgi:hypothetical protein
MLNSTEGKKRTGLAAMAKSNNWRDMVAMVHRLGMRNKDLHGENSSTRV